MLCSQARACKDAPGDSFNRGCKQVASFLLSCASGIACERDAWENPWPPESSPGRWVNVRLCDGECKFVVWLHAGDAEWFANYLNCAHWCNVENPCWCCPANHFEYSTCSVHDCSKNAPFKDMLFTERDAPMSTHCLVQDLGLCRQHNPGDWQHSGALGAFQRIAGSELQEHLTSRHYTGTHASRLEQLWADIRELTCELGITNRMTNLTLSMFYSASSYPILKAKAAETEALMPILAELCDALRDPHSLTDSIRLRMLRNVCRGQDIIRQGSMFLTARESDELLESWEEVMACNNYLLHSCLEQGRLRYSMTIKHHYMWHVCYLGRFPNPRFAWCYPWEDYMGRLVVSAKTTMASSPPELVGKKLM
jgi:hypothetical protein